MSELKLQINSSIYLIEMKIISAVFHSTDYLKDSNKFENLRSQLIHPQPIRLLECLRMSYLKYGFINALLVYCEQIFCSFEEDIFFELRYLSSMYDEGPLTHIAPLLDMHKRLLSLTTEL